MSTESDGFYAVQDTDEIIHDSGGASAITITLLTAVGRKSKGWFVKKTDLAASPVTIVCYGSQKIEGQVSYKLMDQYQHAEYYSDDANYMVKNSN